MTIDDELLEIPEEFRLRIRLDSISLQVLAERRLGGTYGLGLRSDQRVVERMFGFADHGDLFKHRKVDTVVRGAKGLDVGIRAGFLTLEIVRGKTSNDQATIAVITIQFLETFVLRCKSALGRDVDDKKDFVVVLAKGRCFAGDAAHRDFLDGCTHDASQFIAVPQQR